MHKLCVLLSCDTVTISHRNTVQKIMLSTVGDKWLNSS